jgi:TatA/E family protein of Tat protein translocase
MFGLKMSELVIILVIALVLFGGTKLPQLGSSLGQAIRNFKKGFGTEDHETPEAQPRPKDVIAGGGSETQAPSRSATPAGKDV